MNNKWIVKFCQLIFMRVRASFHNDVKCGETCGFFRDSNLKLNLFYCKNFLYKQQISVIKKGDEFIFC